MACTRENTWFQRGTAMLDTHLGVVDTWKHVVPARDHHVRYLPWAVWTRENTWFKLGTIMLDIPLCGLDT